MTYIGSVKDSGGSMSDERRMEQERIQGFCSSMPSGDQAALECAEAFRGLAAEMGAIGAAMNAAQQGLPLPYLIVPRQERTEVEMLREKLAAMEALIVALTPAPAAPVANVMARAISRWPGSQGFLEGIR